MYYDCFVYKEKLEPILLIKLLIARIEQYTGVFDKVSVKSVLDISTALRLGRENNHLKGEQNLDFR